MSEPLPCGTWPSPLSPADAARSTPRVEGARFVGDDVWWGQSLPDEDGRMAVLSRRSGALLPAPFSLGSRVHEYGGGTWTASRDGILYFVERSDQCVWELVPGGEPRRLTDPGHGHRHGGLDWQHGRLLAVRETVTEDAAPRRAIVEIVPDAVPVVHVLGEGTRFVAHPALSPSGRRLAWVGWDHPDMPWDHTRVWVRDLSDATPARAVTDGHGSVVQPMWEDEDTLLVADDVSGRWNIHRVPAAGGASVPVAPADADTGGALWVLGTRWFRPLRDGRIVAVRTHGVDEVVLVDARSGAVTPTGLDVVAGASVDDVDGTRALVTGAGPDTSTAVWAMDADHPQEAERIAGGARGWDPAYSPAPRPITVDGPHGPVHAYDWAPTSPAAHIPDGERPPYIVFVHGGPTSHTSASAQAKTVFFTSRGIGVLDVDYGGSTGYGRAYRERLRGQWGVVDVDDVAAAAAGLAAAGVADPARLAIEGGSAGGWTVLSALVRTDVFAAGISRYGVGDARALAADTHDFESRYLDGLIGPLPEASALYTERSPLSHPERFRVPVLLLQGADDPVVPPAQAEAVRDALAARGVRHASVLYPGEGHGFRRPATIADMLEREVAFLGAVFGFTPPEVRPLRWD